MVLERACKRMGEKMSSSIDGAKGVPNCLHSGKRHIMKAAKILSENRAIKSMRGVIPLKRGDCIWHQKSKKVFSHSLFLLKIFDWSKGVALSVIVKKKIGCAVVRNRIKRRVRRIFFLLWEKKIFTKDKAYLVIVKDKSLAVSDFSVLLDAFSLSTRQHV
jgi:ribonuclease P protein component